MQARRRILGGVLPFVPVLVGAGLTFALIDVVSGDVSTHFFDHCLRPAWIEVVVLAYGTGFVALLSKKQNDDTDIWLLLGVPAVCFVACILLATSGTKAGFENDWLQVYIPALIAAARVATTGGRIVHACDCQPGRQAGTARSGALSAPTCHDKRGKCAGGGGDHEDGQIADRPLRLREAVVSASTDIRPNRRSPRLVRGVPGVDIDPHA
ncbi:hypothetical protein DFR52_10418 [Hoeflea marina]|uniref:Uncharacterized protein n=1 Tax=Hoeflea marina TaxID=274592 RepID=A0A317PJJ8_9HYPH|nr:hypothetical protein [Hoeflea marina]PWV98729.1 hypothetical protein DFR52_10418 [Hoeflea marina]